MKTATLCVVGGSVSGTLPRQMLRTLGLAAGAAVVTFEDGRLVLSPARLRYTLGELLVAQPAGGTAAALLAQPAAVESAALYPQPVKR